VVLSLLLVVATLALYYPVHRHPFIKYDDNDYVYENRNVQAGLSWTSSSGRSPLAMRRTGIPVTWLSHALDCQLFGLGPAARTT